MRVIFILLDCHGYLQANTDILVGVKAELGVPALRKPDEGKLEFFVDW